MDFENEKLDILIQGGQSNAEGFGLGPVECEYVPCGEILYLVDDRTVEVLPQGVRFVGDKGFSITEAGDHLGYEGICGDFSLSFAKEYVRSGRLRKDRKLLIIRTAVGGTGFVTAQWGLQDALYTRLVEMVDYALALNPENRVVGFLWHQGETDAIEGNTKETYKNQLVAMLNDVRMRYGKSPFIAGDFVYEWKNHNIGIAAPIVETIRQVCEECEVAAFVETNDLPSNNQRIGNGDESHFCRESLRELGCRYFSAYEGMIEAM